MLRGFFLGVIAASVVLFLVDWGGDLKSIEVAGFSPAQWLDSHFSSRADTPPPEEVTFTPEPEPVPETPALDVAPVEPLPAFDAPPTAPEAVAAPSAALFPEAVSPGVLYDDTGAEAVAPLTIVTNPGEDYYVKLVYEATNTAAIGIYVQGGVSNEVLIPLGRYEMRYAAGTTWYGLTDLFGPDTVYAKALDILDFRIENGQYSGYTVELILQEGGNLDTQPVGPADF